MTVINQVLTYPLVRLAEESATNPFDAVIVGGGTAGIVAALTLVENRKRVAVIEAGPVALLTHSTTTDMRFDRDSLRKLRGLLDYRPNLAGGGNFGTLIGCLGGRGLFWNGAAPRFLNHNFAGWPFGLSELAPYYDWAERQFRVSRDYGSTALTNLVCRLLRLIGMQAEPGPFAIDTHRTGDGWIGGTIANAMSLLLRSGYLSQATNPLKISVECFAQRILFGPSPDVIRGVACVNRATGETHEIIGSSVVLACGAFESVQLAMTSVALDVSGRTGRGVMEHFFGRAYNNLPPEIFDPLKPEAAIAFVPSTTDCPYQLEIQIPGNNLFHLKDESAWKPAPNADYAAMIRGFAPVGVNADNWIEPGSSGKPGSFTVHFAYTPEELAVRDSMKDAIARAGTALRGVPSEVTILPPGASFHEAGGLAMGADATKYVTDAYGRFHACPRLVVVDASCWPTIGASNPHLTIAAISRRHSLQLSKDLQ